MGEDESQTARGDKIQAATAGRGCTEIIQQVASSGCIVNGDVTELAELCTLER